MKLRENLTIVLLTLIVSSCSTLKDQQAEIPVRVPVPTEQDTEATAKPSTKPTAEPAVVPVVTYEVSGDTIYEYVPDMHPQDITAVMKWIKYEVEKERLPYCYRRSYPRGVGEIPSDCANSSLEKDRTGGPAGFCYPKCNPGYHGVGPVCWQDCPSGFRDDGAFCAKPAPYGRGAGRLPDVKCPKGFWQRGVGAAAWCDNRAFWLWELQVTSATITCKRNEEMNGGLCYPKCKSGYHAVGCCVCSPDCPPHLGADIGVSCTKHSYGRGVGELSTCPPGTIRDETGGPAGLCYPKCNPGYHGVGPVCWQDCDPGWKNCGAGCAKDDTECASSTFDQVFSVAMVAVNIATLGMATPATAGTKAAGETVKFAGKTLTSSTKVGRALISAVNKMDKVAEKGKKGVTVIKKAYNSKNGQLARETYSTVKDAHEVTQAVYTSALDFYTAYAEDFSEVTSPAINKKMDDNFHPATARYLKAYWANIQLAEMASTNQLTIAQDVLSIVSIVDVTGLTGVVSAFTKPVCGEFTSWPDFGDKYK
jgi:hypothetical protein